MSDYPHCTNCGQPMRPKGALLKDHPGTVAYVSKKFCITCKNSGNRRGAASERFEPLTEDELRVEALVRAQSWPEGHGQVLSMLRLLRGAA